MAEHAAGDDRAKNDNLNEGGGGGDACSTVPLVRHSSFFDYSHVEDPEHGTSTIMVATFNLIATIVGGGVLSVPYAFSKCGGVVWGILWMGLAALITDQSCLMLCWCARPEHHHQSDNPFLLSSYGQVGKAAFGPVLEVVISALLFVFLIFVLVAYMVLAKDIWTPIFLAIFNPDKHLHTTQQESDKYWAPYVLLGIVVFMSPFFIQRTLYALRFNCYIGFFSVSILCLALCHHALFPRLETETSAATTENNNTPLTNMFGSYDFWFRPADSIQDVATAFPILMLSLMCHFNVNPIQKALKQPTPQRIQYVMHIAVLGCAILVIFFGVGGYAYVLVNPHTSPIVQGNILLNCEEQEALVGFDWFLFVGRAGCGITIMLAMAIMILPCRDSLLEVVDIAVYHHESRRQHGHQEKQTSASGGAEETAAMIVSEDSPLLLTVTTFHDSHSHAEQRISILQPPSLSESKLVHYLTTFLIVLICYLCAVRVPGVAIVWSLCGSSMAFSIAFILPAACYLEIMYNRQQQQRRQPREDDPDHDENEDEDVRRIMQSPSKIFAWALLIFSILGAIVCTAQTIQSML
jgi:amino acid permease